MKRQRQILTIFVLMILIGSIQQSFATPTLNISTSKQVYEYGDFLSISFHVSELVGNQITFNIIDSSGNSSKPINWPITNLTSTIIAPVPFDKERFKPGTYHITAEYSGVNASTSFEIIDSGKISIPYEIKMGAKALQSSTIPDNMYIQIIQNIINSGVIDISNSNDKTLTHLPKWFKNNIDYWINDSITDNELGLGLKYLIEKGIILV